MSQHIDTDVEVEVIPLSKKQMTSIVELGDENSKRELLVAEVAQDKTNAALAWIGVALTAISIALTVFWYSVGVNEVSKYFSKDEVTSFVNFEPLADALVDHADIRMFMETDLDVVLIFVSLTEWNFVALSVMFILDISLVTLFALKRWSYIMHSILLLIWVASIAEPVFQNESPDWTCMIIMLQIFVTNFWIAINFGMCKISDPVPLDVLMV